MKVGKREVIYSVYPNANGFGYVIMEGPRDLLDFGTIRVRPVENSRIITRIRKHLKYYCPNVIVVLCPSTRGKRTGNRNRLLAELIRDLSMATELSYYQYTRDDIGSVFDGFYKHTKYDIAKFLLTEFSVLINFKPTRRKLWKSEDRNMAIFDALSLALTYYYHQV